MVNIKTLLGEISGDELINIGDIVEVNHDNRITYGRLNNTSKKEIKVGTECIQVENIINIIRVR